MHIPNWCNRAFFCIEVPVHTQEIEWSCIHMLLVSMLPLFVRFFN